jgi:hypothetical protein
MVTAVDVTIARSDLYYCLHHLNLRPHIARCKAGATGNTAADRETRYGGIADFASTSQASEGVQTTSLAADRANHVDSGSQLRQHAKLSLASPVSLGRNVFTRPRPIADIA